VEGFREAVGGGRRRLPLLSRHEVTRVTGDRGEEVIRETDDARRLTTTEREIVLREMTTLLTRHSLMPQAQKEDRLVRWMCECGWAGVTYPLWLMSSAIDAATAAWTAAVRHQAEALVDGMEEM